MSSGRAALCDCWALPARKCPGRSQCRWPPASRASVTWKHKLLGRKAILPQGPWGRGKVPPAWLMRLTAWPLSRVRPCGGPKRPGAWTSPAGSACPRSRAAPPDRFLRVPGAQVAGSDRRCQVATIEPGLRAAPPPGRGSSSCLARGPSGNLSPPSLPRRPYRSGHLSEFPVSPHLGREPRSRRSSGNTPGLQRFSRNKETDRQSPPIPSSRRKKAHLWSPSRGHRGQVEQEPVLTEGIHSRNPEAPSPPTNWPGTHRTICPSRAMPRGPRHAASSQPPRRSLCAAQVGKSRTCGARAAHTWLHLPPPPPSTGSPSWPRFSLLLPGS